MRNKLVKLFETKTHGRFYIGYSDHCEAAIGVPIGDSGRILCLKAEQLARAATADQGQKKLQLS